MAWNEFQREPSWQLPHLAHSGVSPEIIALLAKQNQPIGQEIAQTLQKAAPELMKAYQGYKADQIANNLMQNQDAIGQAAASGDSAAAADLYKQAGLTGTGALQQWEDDQQAHRQDTADWYKSQLENQKLWPDNYGGDESGRPGSPQVDPATGLIWNGHQWVKGPGHGSPENDLSLASAIARGKLDASGKFTNAYPEAATGDYVKLMTPQGKTLTVPWNAYQTRVGGQNPTQGQAAGAISNDAAPSAVNPAAPAKVRVISPDGTPGFIPADRLQDYLASGYTQG